MHPDEPVVLYSEIDAGLEVRKVEVYRDGRHDFADQAGEFNTTLGVAGPVPGVTATSFNGTSSWIPLDGTWCTTPGLQSAESNQGGAGSEGDQPH
jgi:hypothetical protein